ncbi:hypothetical protein JVT61DRAFT_6184 [Boletus reticuloceps]|uniref:Phytanoyl-CoA dioxygenase family protein n=1 Tax=Boletus reticuloceps TaxID=495285 RepID=A0A8I2YKD0_9AGAM|nr:hypothetical protein JVT61DRAFT_6184 [Boletus reticuloceps]
MYISESLLKAAHDDQGYVLVPDLIPSDLLPALRAACDRVIAKTRTGAWPHRRTVGKQFPPFDDAHPDSWGVQHVMHPALGEPVFAQWYTSEGVRTVSAALLGCDVGSLQMELFNLLINPLNHDFALRWHRDDVRENATPEEELKALASWSRGVQWNTALYEDACLYLVPKSHKVPRTDEQRVHSTTLEPPRDPLAMPGSIRLVLQRKCPSPCVWSVDNDMLTTLSIAGETVFYNSNILHCATYDAQQRRATLHATMGDTRGGSSRARNVLQHGLEWMQEKRFRETLDEGGQRMLDALVEMRNGVQGEVGYSLTG